MHKACLTLPLVLLLSSCALFQPHRQVIEQGNIITPELTSQLHPGMSEDAVKSLLGSPLLANIFTPGRVDYVYTYRKGNGDFLEKRVTCIFVHGRLKTYYIS